MIGTKPTQRDVTDGGLDVAVDEPGVPVRGGSTDLATFVGDPGVRRELAERDRPGRCSGGGAAFASGGELFGFGSVVADGMPASACPSGKRVGPS